MEVNHGGARDEIGCAFRPVPRERHVAVENTLRDWEGPDAEEGPHRGPSGRPASAHRTLAASVPWCDRPSARWPAASKAPQDPGAPVPAPGGAKVPRSLRTSGPGCVGASERWTVGSQGPEAHRDNGANGHQCRGAGARRCFGTAVPTRAPRQPPCCSLGAEYAAGQGSDAHKSKQHAIRPPFTSLFVPADRPPALVRARLVAMAGEAVRKARTISAERRRRAAPVAGRGDLGMDSVEAGKGSRDAESSVIPARRGDGRRRVKDRKSHGTTSWVMMR